MTNLLHIQRQTATELYRQVRHETSALSEASSIIPLALVKFEDLVLLMHNMESFYQAVQSLSNGVLSPKLISPEHFQHVLIQREGRITILTSGKLKILRKKGHTLLSHAWFHCESTKWRLVRPYSCTIRSTGKNFNPIWNTYVAGTGSKLKTLYNCNQLTQIRCIQSWIKIFFGISVKTTHHDVQIVIFQPDTLSSCLLYTSPSPRD